MEDWKSHKWVVFLQAVTMNPLQTQENKILWKAGQSLYHKTREWWALYLIQNHNYVVFGTAQLLYRCLLNHSSAPLAQGGQRLFAV